MKRFVSLISIILCISSLSAISWDKKDAVDIFGDKTGDSIIYTIEPQEGWFSDINHDHEPISWTARIEKEGYISFDILENGILSDLSVPSPYLISLKSNDGLSIEEYDAYSMKSDKYCTNRITSNDFYIDEINFSEPVKIVIYNDEGIYNLGTVDFSEVESLLFDKVSYDAALSLMNEGKYIEAKTIIKQLDLETYYHYNCQSLVYSLDNVIYLDAARIKYEEGDYTGAKALLDELYFVNHKLYETSWAVTIRNNVDIKFGLEAIAKGQISNGCKAIFNAKARANQNNYYIGMDDEVLKAATTFLSSLSSRNEIDKSIADLLKYEPQDDSFWSSLLILYAKTLENKGLINTPSQTSVYLIRELFKEEQSNIESASNEILVDALYLSCVTQEAKKDNYKYALHLLDECLSLSSVTKEEIEETIENLLMEYCERLEKAQSDENDSSLSVCNITSYYSFCNNTKYFKDAVYLEEKYQINNGDPYYTKQYFVEDKEIKANLTNRGMSFTDVNGIGYSQLRGNIIFNIINEIQKRGYQDLERTYIPDEIKVKEESIDVDIFNSLWKYMIKELLPAELEIDYPIEIDSDAYQEGSLRTRSIETINGTIIGSQYKDELVFIVNKSLFKILSNGKLDMLSQIEYTIQETENSVIIHLPDTYLFDDIFCYLEELASEKVIFAFVFRGDGIIARSRYCKNYVEIKTDKDEQFIDEIIELNKDQFGDYYFDKEGSDVIIYYPSFFLEKDADMLWEEIKGVLQDYFAEKEKEEINNQIVQPIELTESTYHTSSLYDMEQSNSVAFVNNPSKQDVPSEKTNINGKYKLVVGLDVMATIFPLREGINNPEGVKEYRTYKGFITPYFGFSMRIGDSYYWGTRVGLSFATANINTSFNSRTLYVLPSIQGECGTYIKDTILNAKVFVRITPKISIEKICNIIVGMSIGFPYMEIGLAIDSFVNPIAYFAFQYEFSL